MTKKNVKTTDAEKVVFSKEKILQMKRYAERVDLLRVLLLDDKQYSHEDVKEVIQNFNER